MRSMTITMSRTMMMGSVVSRARPNDVINCAEEATPLWVGPGVQGDTPDVAKVTWTVVEALCCVLVPRIEAWVRTGEEAVLVGGFDACVAQ